MATGGIFTLITNDGRQDRMLMATALLNRRLKEISEVRKALGGVDSTPTLVDIEKTHVLFTNAHFKPFAAIGYEYNKVRASTGSPSLGSEVQFSIPQFGDFFHDMVLHIKLKQPTLTTTTGVLSNQPAMRWCAFPGERALAKVDFEVNGNPLDSYQSSVYNMYREFQVGPWKRDAWDRCVGQEAPMPGFVDQQTWVGSGVAPSALTSRFGVNVYNGAQTPTGQKSQTEAGDLELFVPLLFWCNKDARLSVPSVSIPYGQRFINVKLATQAELVNIVPRGTGTYAAPNGALDESANIVRSMELYINNIFVNPEIHDIYIKRIGFSLIRVHRIQNSTVNTSSGEVLLQQLKWPIEALFVGMKVAEYNSTTAALRAQHLDKWHRFSKVNLVSQSAGGWIAEKQFTITGATLAVAASVTSATVITATGTLVLNTELLPGDIIIVAGQRFTVDSPLVATATTVNVTSVSSSAILAIGATANFSTLRLGAQTSTVEDCDPTIDSMTIKAHSIPIYNDFPSGFYNSYLPLHFGGTNIIAPKDCGALFVPFGLYPGTYQPSGHINISRAREFYLEYVSSVISSSVIGTLVVIASAINFLLISDGSAILRYST